jgi:DNA repair exonuclease SbcCD ATPase subunit
MQDESFPQFLERYNHYLRVPQNRDNLLAIGYKLFGRQALENVERPSFNLLRAKENELKVTPKRPEQKMRFHTAKTTMTRNEPSSASNPDQLTEDIMVLQDRNSVLLARRKTLENQRNEMNSEYGSLMEHSVQEKVKLKREMHKLRVELQEALSRSRPSFASEESEQRGPVMNELEALNQQILDRIGSFKMALSTDETSCELAVMSRYKPQMEKLLGQVYPHSDYLPVSDVIEKFGSLSFKIENEIKEFETETKHEHERNKNLQKEAKELEDEMERQEKDVNQLRKKNSYREGSIELLKSIANAELVSAKRKYQNLLDITSDDTGATPSSARAMIMTTGNENRKIKKTSSGKFFARKDSAMPQVKSVQEFVAEQHLLLQERIADLRAKANRT